MIKSARNRESRRKENHNNVVRVSGWWGAHYRGIPNRRVNSDDDNHRESSI